MYVFNLIVFSLVHVYHEIANVILIIFSSTLLLSSYQSAEHPHVDIMYGAVELEDIYGSEELRNEVNTKKLSPDQLRLEDLKLGMVKVLLC